MDAELNLHPLAYETKVSTGWPRNILNFSIPRGVVYENESDPQHSSLAPRNMVTLSGFEPKLHP